MEDDNLSVATPTPSELNMFRVMANQDFVDLKRPAPTSRTLHPVPEEHADIFPDVNEDERAEYDEYTRETTRETHRETHRDTPREPDANPFGDRDDRSETRHDPNETRNDRDDTRNDTEAKPDVFWERAKAMTEDEIVSEKEGLLLELQMLEKQGIYKPSRTLTMNDSIEELQFQVDRANSIFSAQQAVDFAKTGIRVGSLALEKGLGRLGLGVLDGFSNNLCKDMNKFNRPLTRLYRKYWRRSGGLTSPEVELLIVVLGSMLITVAGNSNMIGSFLKPKTAAGGPSAPAGGPSAATNATTSTTSTTSTTTTAAKPLIRPPVIPAATWQPVVVPSEAFANEKTVVIDNKFGAAPAPTPRKKVVDVPIVL
jgi:hypothetical protein